MKQISDMYQIQMFYPDDLKTASYATLTNDLASLFNN